MAVILKRVYIFALFLVCYSKDLHIKEDISIKKDNSLRDIFKDDDITHLAGRQRPVRHVELVTETVIQHLINEINKKYPGTRAGAKNSTMPKLIKKLKNKLKKQMKKKKNIKRKKTNKAHTKKLEPTTMNIRNNIV